MDFRDVDDQNLDVKMGVNRGLRMSDQLGDHLKGGDHHDVLVGHRTNAMDDRSLDGNLCHRMNGLLVDPNLDVMTDVNLCHRRNVPLDDLHDQHSGVNLCHRMNDPLDGHLMDDGHRDVLVGHRTNVTDDRNDLKMGGTTDVSRGHRMNDQLDDLNLDAMTDVNLYRHTNVMDDRNDLMMVVNLLNRNCALHDPKMDVMMDANLLNRNYAPRDLNLDANLDGMNLHVRLMDDLSKSCDRMSHDHLLCAHLMMRRHGTNRMDVKNLDVKYLDVKMMNHHVIHRMKGDLMKDCRKMI